MNIRFLLGTVAFAAIIPFAAHADTVRLAQEDRAHPGATMNGSEPELTAEDAAKTARPVVQTSDSPAFNAATPVITNDNADVTEIPADEDGAAPLDARSDMPDTDDNANRAGTESSEKTIKSEKPAPKDSVKTAR